MKPIKKKSSKSVDHDESTIIKSARDDREYRFIELENKMNVLLIHDEKTDKAAAAMNVGVGHWSDPKDISGLAHFLEHMLFLGSEKYPEEDAYSSFLSEHGGSSNAFTEQENTNFFFNVRHEHFYGALDRFAQFFISPQFTPSATEREMNAVDSEHRKNIQADNWRLNQLDKTTSNKMHPYNNFGTGNLKTLLENPKEKGINVHEKLLEFYKKHYSANMMCMVLLGRESLDTLASWANDLFSDVVNKNLESVVYKVPVLNLEDLQKRFYVVPVKDLRALTIQWVIPSQRKHFRKKPTSYIAHLLGHEGPGSILSLLKSKGWANELVAGPARTTDQFTFFKVTLDLTEQGLEYIEDIISIVYQYITLIKKAGPVKWIFEESSQIAAMSFRFMDKQDPMSYVMGLALSMQILPPKYVVSGAYLYDKYDPKLIIQTLNELNTNNMRYTVVSQVFEGKTDKKEYWYSTDYSEEIILKELLEKWTSPSEIAPELSLPPVNEFVPTNFDIKKEEKEEETELPVIIQDTSSCKIWYKKDNIFKQPKANINMEFRSPVAYESPEAHVKTFLFLKLVTDALKEFSYAAELTGLAFKLDSAIVGFQLVVQGYNHKQSVLISKILEQLVSIDIKEDRFILIKEKATRQYKNFKLEQPYSHSIYNTSLATESMRWHNDNFINVIEEITSDQLRNFIPRLLSKIFIEALFHGNVTKEDVFNIMQIIENTLKFKPLPYEEMPIQRLVQLPYGKDYVLQDIGQNTENENTAIENYYQINTFTFEMSSLVDLFCQMIFDPCYHVLRTTEQLGYIVHSGTKFNFNVKGIRIIIQGEKSPVLLDERVEVFLADFPELIEKLSEEEWGRHKQALVAIKLEKPKKITQETLRYWKEIINHTYLFDRHETEAKYIAKIEKKDIIEFFNQYIAKGGAKRRKISSQIFGKNIPLPKSENKEVKGKHTTAITKDNTAILITDFSKFVRTSSLFPGTL